MTPQSTRDRIRSQARWMLQDIERIQIHLKNIDDLAAGQHPVVTEHVPKLVVLFAEIGKLAQDFRDAL